jgi:nitroimidazol reductase NimA-like FMN-containing flavoprotein (pyridoxamine 5'-phosphate oxidase superfamily)
MSDEFAKTARNTLRRLPARGRYDRATVNAILDEGLICQVGFAVDGQPYVIPTIHARIDGVLYLHGAPANHMLGRLGSGIPACVNVTLVDGLVLARSAFHHSLNYRSVNVFGLAVEVVDQQEKRRAMDALVEHVVPGRREHARAPTPKELRSTLVLAVPIDEASAKVRTGPPLDDERDLELDIWAGVVPLTTTAAEPVPAPELPAERAARVPDYARRFGRPGPTAPDARP